MKVYETFRSVQGEGKKIGVPTFFIRSVGCNLDCAWCDTKYAFTGGKEMSVSELCELCRDDDDICFTGGEPLLQKDAIELLKRLSDDGKTVVLETNGSVDISDVPDSNNIIISMDIKCPSSKMEKKNLFSNIKLLGKKDQLKFVLFDNNDFDFAVEVIEKYEPKCECIFSPVGGMEIRPLAEKVIDEGIKVRVLPQLHKIIWGDRQGV